MYSIGFRSLKGAMQTYQFEYLPLGLYLCSGKSRDPKTGAVNKHT